MIRPFTGTGRLVPNKEACVAVPLARTTIARRTLLSAAGKATDPPAPTAGGDSVTLTYTREPTTVRPPLVLLALMASVTLVPAVDDVRPVYVSQRCSSDVRLDAYAARAPSSAESAASSDALAGASSSRSVAVTPNVGSVQAVVALSK